MPGAGVGSGFSQEHIKNNPGLTVTSSTFPKRHPGPAGDFLFNMGSSVGKGMATQLKKKQAAAGKTPLVESKAKTTAKVGRVPSGKRARKHNVRRG